MSDEASGGLGPIFFADYAEHTARLVANYAPSRVLETGAGTGLCRSPETITIASAANPRSGEHR
jgi:hypothetical protein